MSTFKIFAQSVHAQFSAMSANELFVVDYSGDALYEAYIAAFPEGTNPIFRERTEHDCSCCRNFIKNIGNVVSIKDGNVTTVWDSFSTLPHPYDVVAARLAVLVKVSPVKELFRASEQQYGAESSVELLPDGTTRRWNHFHGVVANKHFTKEVGSVVGEYGTTVGVFKRGLEELKPDAFATVVDLIQSNNLYKGQDFLQAITAFQKAQAEYLKLDTQGRTLYVWANGGSNITRFRNTAIGTLLVDLSNGVDLEGAVKSFETKVAPTNYKRPNALITQSMVNDAMKTIEQLGLEPALERRFAVISDVSVNDILFVDNAVRGQMKGGMASLLASAVKPAPISADKAQDIGADEFLSSVLPKATSVAVQVKNAHQPNFVSITAPVHADVNQLFKWDNNFAWSYDGNVTDSLKQKVASLGGRVDGVLRFSHTWNYDARNASLMDLHVFLPGSTPHRDGQHDNYPSGQRVGWNNRSDSISKGIQDVDYVEAAPEGYVPVENITFPDMHRLKDGEYVFKIHNWNLREPTKGGFRAEIEFDGQVFEYDHPAPLKHKEWITVAVATLKNGKFTIEHKHPVGSVSKEKWGINTEHFTSVDTIMLSPNHWGGKQIGSKHVFFILKGCYNPLPTRGIYNEFLRGDLEKHRKVFEVLGNKTMCQPTESQLSGVGFTSARGDSVLVKVNDKKIYNVKF